MATMPRVPAVRSRYGMTVIESHTWTTRFAASGCDSNSHGTISTAKAGDHWRHPLDQSRVRAHEPRGVGGPFRQRPRLDVEVHTIEAGRGRDAPYPVERRGMVERPRRFRTQAADRDPGRLQSRSQPGRTLVDAHPRHREVHLAQPARQRNAATPAVSGGIRHSQVALMRTRPRYGPRWYRYQRHDRGHPAGRRGSPRRGR